MVCKFDKAVDHRTLGKSGKIAPHGSLSLRPYLRAQLAVTSSVKADTFSFRPYRMSKSASRYRPARPHFGHSIRSRSSLPIRSEKMIAPSRGISLALAGGSDQERLGSAEAAK